MKCSTSFDKTLPCRSKEVSVKEWFGVERLKTLIGFMYKLRVNHAVTPFSERIPWLFWRFYLNKLYRYYQA